MAIISRPAVLLGLDAGEFNAGLGKAKDKLEGFSQPLYVNICRLPALAGVLDRYALSALLNRRLRLIW